MKIKIVMPFQLTILDESTERTAKQYAAAGTEIKCVHPEKAPEKIAGQYDEALAVPGLLEEVGKAKGEGFDGVLISCFGDPGLKPARELATIPVVGTCEPCLLIGAALAQRFSVITVPPNLVSLAEDLAKLLGVQEKLASVRHLGVEAYTLGTEELIQRTYEEGVKAIEQDRAHALLLGCTCLLDVAIPLHEKLIAMKGYDVPVIDPVGAPVKFLESLIALKLSQSKLTYMEPAK